MANQWLRLWHDMPNDPKWRTIARASGQSIALVQAVYLHLLVDASRNVTRGHVSVTPEDLASALDVTESDVEAVLQAMQGRVLDGDHVSGWDARQPKREDAGSPETGAKSAAQRKREQRAREKETGQEQQCHEQSRTVTTDKDTEKSKREDQELTPQPPKGEVSAQPPVPTKVDKPDPMEGFAEFWLQYPKKKSKHDAEKAWAKLKPNAELRSLMTASLAAQVKSPDWTKDRGQYVPLPATWLNGKRWADEILPADLLDKHHGFNGQRDYTQGLEANGDGTYRF